MSVSKISPVYTTNTKATNDTLAATEWNSLSGAVNSSLTKINQIIDEIENISTGSGEEVVVNSPLTIETDATNSSKKIVKIQDILVMDLTEKSKGTNVTLAGNNNINIEPREANGTGADKNDNNGNMKGGNIALKPGDDIELWAHHRGTDKNDEVSIKILTEDDKEKEIPAKLQLNTSDIVITSKDKVTDNDITNIIFNKAKGTRGYLKVRAQAIDLRCEEHGGVALQPMGYDGDGNMNKIKFEHGGGDGLEFGTFNSEKTSIYTDEYRFKKDGIWKMATREKLDNTSTLIGTKGVDIGNLKYVADKSNETLHYSYKKQSDDFYDVIDSDDVTTTTENIIKTANAFNNNEIETKNTDFGLDISTAEEINITAAGGTSINGDITIGGTISNPTTIKFNNYTTKIQTYGGVDRRFDTIYNIVKAANVCDSANLGLLTNITSDFGGAYFNPIVFKLRKLTEDEYERIIVENDPEVSTLEITKWYHVSNSNLKDTMILFPSDINSFYATKSIQYSSKKSYSEKLSDLNNIINIENNKDKYLKLLNDSDTLNESSNDSLNIFYEVTKITTTIPLDDICKYVYWAKENKEGPWAE